jgi:alpha-L-fucosidase
MFERDLPGENKGGHSPDSKIGNLPLETCDTINGAWGYNAGDKRFKSVPDLIRYLVRAAGRDANFLLNVGPRPDGTLDPESVKRLQGIGEWMAKFGHTIRSTRGGPIAPQPWGVSTQTPEVVYLHVLDASAADDTGWLALSGSEGLSANEVRAVADGSQVKSRKDPNGLLAVKLDTPTDAIDLVLQVAK